MMHFERAQWLTDKYIMAMLCAFPLFTGFQGYGAITAAKEGFFALATGLWLAGVLLMLLIAGLKREPMDLVLRPAHFAVTAFMLWAALSALASPWWETALLGTRFDGLVTQVLYGMIFLGVSLLGKPRRKYIWALAAAVTVSNVIALLQLMGLDPFGFYPDGTNYYDKFGAYNSAFLGTVGNVGLVGQYLCLATPVLVIFGLRSEERREKLLLWAAALLCQIVLVFSQAEAAYVGALGGVLVAVPLMLPKAESRKKAALAAGGLVLLGLIVAFFWPGDSGTLWELSRVLHGDIRDEFGSRRVQIWRAALDLVKERPLLGGGPGTFGERVDIVWERYVEAIRDVRRAAVTNTHNLYIGYLVNHGIPGLLAYLSILACSGVTWLRRRFEDPYAAAFGCALLCACIQDFFCLNVCLVTPLMWVLWGLLESKEPRE